MTWGKEGGSEKTSHPRENSERAGGDGSGWIFFSFNLAVPYSMWDLSSHREQRTDSWPLHIGSAVLTIGLLGKSPVVGVLIPIEDGVCLTC